MKFKVEIKEASEMRSYDFGGNGTYSAFWVSNQSTYPDTNPTWLDICQDTLTNHGFVNQNNSLKEAHVTLVYSPTDLITSSQYKEISDYANDVCKDGLSIKVKGITVWSNPNGTHLVAELEQHPALLKINSMFKSYGLSETFPIYKPHMTLFTTDEVMDPTKFSNVKDEISLTLMNESIIFTCHTISNLS